MSKDRSPIFESPDTLRDQYTPDLRKGVFVFVRVNDSSKNLDQIEQELKSFRPPPNTDVPPIVSVVRTKVGSEDAVKYTSHYGSQVVGYILVRGNKKFEINCNHVINDEHGLRLCEKIAVTFSFLE